ncbi:hypothetical protein HNP40_002517 [Mycobacteroides chelonae]|nr:hypothetical protein [Mycobacteroides chelonae]
MLKLASISDPRSATAQYALTEVADECRHSVMFGRQINTLSDRSCNPPMIARALVGVTAPAPLSATVFSMMLMVEEILHRLQRQTMNDETLQPGPRHERGGHARRPPGPVPLTVLPDVTRTPCATIETDGVRLSLS